MTEPTDREIVALKAACADANRTLEQKWAPGTRLFEVQSIVVQPMRYDEDADDLVTAGVPFEHFTDR